MRAGLLLCVAVCEFGCALAVRRVGCQRAALACRRNEIVLCAKLLGLSAEALTDNPVRLLWGAVEVHDIQTAYESAHLANLPHLHVLHLHTGHHPLRTGCPGGLLLPPLSELHGLW